MVFLDCYLILRIIVNVLDYVIDCDPYARIKIFPGRVGGIEPQTFAWLLGTFTGGNYLNLHTIFSRLIQAQR
jgi:hypothetical protein